MNRITFAGLILIMIVAASCDNGDKPIPPDEPTVKSGVVTWDANVPEDSVIYYTVFHGISSRIYTDAIETPDTTAIFDSLSVDIYHYFAVTATNQYGQSEFSNEVSLAPDREARYDTLRWQDINGLTMFRVIRTEQGLVLNPIQMSKPVGHISFEPGQVQEIGFICDGSADVQFFQTVSDGDDILLDTSETIDGIYLYRDGLQAGDRIRFRLEIGEEIVTVTRFLVKR